MNRDELINEKISEGLLVNDGLKTEYFRLSRVDIKKLMEDFARSEFENTLTKVFHSTANDMIGANYFLLRKRRNKGLDTELLKNPDKLKTLLAEYREKIRGEILNEVRYQSRYRFNIPAEAKTQKEENNKEEQKESLETLARKRATEIHYLREASYYAPLNIVEKAREFLKENIFKENGKIKFEPYSLKVFLAQFVNKKFPNAEIHEVDFEEKKKQAGGDADSIEAAETAFPEKDSETATTTENIKKVCRSIMGVLVEKNNRYGNSALEPKKIFSGLNSEEGIRIRLDDKLGRIKNSQELRKNDVADLIGYAILLSVTKGWIFDDLID